MIIFEFEKSGEGATAKQQARSERERRESPSASGTAEHIKLWPMAEELDRDRPLFNDEVAVQVKFPDHEKTLALTVRVLQGSRLAPVGSGGGQREGVLHIEVTDELDPFFLYTLQVREFFKEGAVFGNEQTLWTQTS